MQALNLLALLLLLKLTAHHHVQAGSFQSTHANGELVTSYEFSGRFFRASTSKPAGSQDAPNKAKDKFRGSFRNYIETTCIAANIDMSAMDAGAGHKNDERAEIPHAQTWNKVDGDFSSQSHPAEPAQDIQISNEVHDQCTIHGIQSAAVLGTSSTFDEVETSVGVAEMAPPGCNVRGQGSQVPFAAILNHPHLLAAIKVFSCPADLLKGLDNGKSYDFVRLKDGSFRAISHEDAAAVAGTLKSKVPINHLSLIPKDAAILAAGELHMNPNGILQRISCQSGHFRFPTKLAKRRIGYGVPETIITNQSPTFIRILYYIRRFFPNAQTLTLSDWAVAVVIRDQPSYWHIVTVRVDEKVEVFACSSMALAQAVFMSIPKTMARVLWVAKQQVAARKKGLPEYVRDCMEQAEVFANDFAR